MARGKIEKRGQRRRKIKPVILIVTEGSQTEPMIFLVIANVPLLYFLNEDWFHTLIFTTPGKIALAICAAIILFALTQIMKLSKPIEYGGDSV